MKLIVISHWRFPSEKTMSAYIMRVCEAFAKQGIDAELWVPKRYNPQFSGVDPFEYHDIGKRFPLVFVPVFDGMRYFPEWLGFWVMRASFALSLFLRIWRMKERREFVFYCFDLRDAWPISFLSNKIFCEIHMYYKTGNSLINRRLFSAVRAFPVATKSLMEELRMRYGIAPERMIHAPCAVNSERFAIDTSKVEARHKLGLSAVDRIILYVGHLFPVKGVDILFEIYPMLGNGEKLYFVGGTDSDLERFRKKWKDASSPPNVVIAGRKPHREVPLWLRAADVLVIPNTAKDPASSYESSPSKLLEYMASGRPIAASDVPGIRDVLDDSMGFFFEPDDPHAIASAIKQIFSDEKEADARAERAREIAKVKYSWDVRAVMVKKFLEGYIL